VIRRLLSSLALGCALVALLAGCGSSSSSSGSSDTSSQSSSGSTSTKTSTSTSTSPSSATGAVADCQRGIKSLPALSASTRERLESACAKSGSGGTKATRKVIAEACREIIEASPLPDGPGKQKALAGCESAASQ
jgi:hypothetical protein